MVVSAQRAPGRSEAATALRRVTTGGQTFHTRGHLCTQCLQGQQAREKEWAWIIKVFFPYVKKKIDMLQEM